MAIYPGQLLQPTHQHQNDHDEQYQSESTGGAVTPIAAVTPVGQSTDKKKNHENKYY
jgi:hypothetical protein